MISDILFRLDHARDTLKTLERALALAERQEKARRGLQSWIAGAALDTLRERIAGLQEMVSEIEAELAAFRAADAA